MDRLGERYLGHRDSSDRQSITVSKNVTEVPPTPKPQWLPLPAFLTSLKCREAEGQRGKTYYNWSPAQGFERCGEKSGFSLIIFFFLLCPWSLSEVVLLRRSKLRAGSRREVLPPAYTAMEYFFS